MEATDVAEPVSQASVGLDCCDEVESFVIPNRGLAAC